MIFVEPRSGFWRDLRSAPAEVGTWAMEWIEAAKAPGATLSQITQGAFPLKGGEFQNSYVRKWRRKKPHGEYRLVFRATEEKVEVISLQPRGADYKIAGRRIRAISS